MSIQQMSEKNQKTSNNQSTKFHQLQALFGHQGATIKDIANLQNNLISSKNSTPNGSLENINLIYSENEVSEHFSNFSGSEQETECKQKQNLIFQLRKAFTRQSEEIKNLRNQLASSDKRVQELEVEVKRLQTLLK